MMCWHDRPLEGLEGLKYSHQEYEHQCLSMVFKDWDQTHQRTTQALAVDVSSEGSIGCETKFYLAATLADHPQMDKFRCIHSKFYSLFSNIEKIM